MRNSIQRAIELLFETAPFSRKNEEQKEELLSLAYQKFEDGLENGTNPAKAAGEMLIHSGTLQDICSYLKVEACKQIQEPDKIKKESAFLKTLKRLRITIYLFSFLVSSIISSVLGCFFDFSIKGLLFSVVIWTALGILLCFALKRKKQITEDNNFFDSEFDNKCRKAAEKKYDLYTKKLTNAVFGICSIAFILVFSVLLSVTAYKSSLADVLSTVSFYLSAIQLSVYLFLKNYFCRKLFADFFCKAKTKMYLHELWRIGAYSVAYYSFFLVFLLLFRNRMENSFLVALAAVAVYFIIAAFYNATLRHNFVHKNIVVNVKKIVCFILIMACLLTYNVMKLDLYLLQPYISRVAEVEHSPNEILYNEDTGIYTIVAKEDSFKILQLTDIHLGGSILSISEDMKALHACYQLISETSPDLVVVTGDLVFPLGIMSFSFNNSAPVMQFANFMRNTGIPWAFTYGNHDTEELATLNRTEVDILMKSLSYKSSKNLLYPYVQPDIYGRSNQMIEIRAEDGSLMQALFLIDSNDYIASGSINEYDYIHDDQVEWYKRTVTGLSEREGHTVSSMIFTHIPLREYKEANDLYEQGSSDVIYYYGILGEKMIDKICCSRYKSKLFETVLELGSTKAIFCGHDHYNNQSVEYKGVRLTYGYSIDYLAMPGIDKHTEQRGATLITIQKDGSFDITPYKLIDLE